MEVLTGLPPEAKKNQPVAMDIEMFGQKQGKLHRPVGTFACLSITLDGKTVYQVFDTVDIRKALRAVRKGTWIFHNALYDLRQLQRWATIPPRFIWDTMLVEQSMRGGYFRNFSLADLSRRLLHMYLDKDVREGFIDDTSFTKEMKQYAAKDVIVTWKVAEVQRREYSDDLGFRAYKDIDEPMIFPVLDMPGMRVDVDSWSKAIAEFDARAKNIEAEIGFNVKSPQQCLSALRKVNVNLSDTTSDTLLSCNSNPLVAKIIEGRLYRDAVSKYGMTWLESHVEDDGKVYPSWHITGAETGRMSSSDPNGQNIPQRKLPIYRTFFIASKGNVMMIDDASQQEPCILAYESKDEELLKALRSGEDLHLSVARTIYGDPSIGKEDPKRFTGKTINLGTSYGLSSYGLARRMDISESEATVFLSKYFSRFKDVLLWTGEKRRYAFRNGYVETSSGRRAFVNTYDDQWQNNAINAPIQGGAADQMKMWVRGYWERCKSNDIPFNLTGIIHDEQVKDVPKELRKKAKALSDEAFLTSAEKLFPGIPFKVESHVGRSWAVKSMKEEEA